jgi:hypothetical protein
VVDRLKHELLSLWKSNGIEKYCYSPLNVSISDIIRNIKKKDDAVSREEGKIESAFAAPKLPSVPGVPYAEPPSHPSLYPLLNVGFSRIVLGMAWYVLHIATHNNFPTAPEGERVEKAGEGVNLMLFYEKKIFDFVFFFVFIADVVDSAKEASSSSTTVPSKRSRGGGGGGFFPSLLQPECEGCSSGSSRPTKVAVEKESDATSSSVTTPSNVPPIAFTNESVSMMVFSIARLLDATLNSVDLNTKNDEVNTSQFRKGSVIHPLSLPLKKPSSEEEEISSAVLLLLQAVFTEQECGCSIITEGLKEGSSEIAVAEKNRHQSIASLLYQYYISSFHLSFPVEPYSSTHFFFCFTFFYLFNFQL